MSYHCTECQAEMDYEDIIVEVWYSGSRDEPRDETWTCPECGSINTVEEK